MKKLWILIMTLLALSCNVYAETSVPQLSVNDDMIQFSSATGYPFIDTAGRVQVPVRQFAEAIKASVSWDQTSKHVLIDKNQEFVIIEIGKNYYEKDGSKQYMDTVSTIRNGRTYLPLRAIAEALDYKVSWNANTKVASLSTEDHGKLMIRESDIPVNLYRAYYYETNHPGTVVATEITDIISVNAAYAFKEIDAQNFSGTWIGDFEFAQDTEKNIDISLSWANASIEIDGKPVFADKYLFMKGKHRIKVDYSNNWHTIGFLCQFNDEVTTIGADRVAAMLKPMITPDTAIEYVGVYESESDDHSLKVDITDKNKPVVLFLSSYSPVNWEISNSGNAKIKAVIFNSFEDGGTVILPAGNTVPIVRMPDLVMAYTPFPSYDEVGHGYHFENLEFQELRSQILNICGMPLAGFTGAYAMEDLIVPEMVMDAVNTKKIDDAFAEVVRLQTKEPQKPSNLFGKDSAGHEISWASRFNSKLVPQGCFQAYYFNTDQPNEVLQTELINRVGISYAWSDFLGVDSNDFGAYYVGDFVFDTDTVRNISLAQQWSYTRVIIDGKVVFDETDHNSGMISYTFTKGTHRIEVQHINDWHTVGFSADFDLLPISTTEAVKAFVNRQLDASTKFYAAMIYESTERDLGCTLKLPDTQESEFLILNSFEPVHWTINTSGHANLKGVILTSNYDGSTVSFIGGRTCEVIRGENTYADIDYVEPGSASISKSSTLYRQVLSFAESFGVKNIHGISASYGARDMVAGSVSITP